MSSSKRLAVVAGLVVATATHDGLAELPPPAPGADADLPPAPGMPEELRWFRPTGLVEIDHRVFRVEEEGLTGFGVGRFRLGAVIAPRPWFRGFVNVELASGAPEVLDALVRLRPHDAITVEIGSTRPPIFASFRDEPVHTMPLPDRSPVIRTFSLQRDVGAGVRVAPAAIPVEVHYRVGNGSGSIVSNDNPYPAVYGAVDLVLGRAWLAATPVDGRPDTFGLRLGVGAMEEDTADRDSTSGITPLGFLYARPIVVAGQRLIGTAYAVGYAGPLRLTVEGATADESRDRDDDGDAETPRRSLPSVQSSGVTAEIAWVVIGDVRRVGQAPSAAPGRWRGGALEIAARFDALWLQRGTGDPSVVENESRGGVAGIKWWPTSFLAASLTGSVTSFDVAPIETPDIDATWGVLQRLSFFWPPPG